MCIHVSGNRGRGVEGGKNEKRQSRGVGDRERHAGECVCLLHGARKQGIGSEENEQSIYLYVFSDKPSASSADTDVVCGGVVCPNAGAERIKAHASVGRPRSM